MLVKSYSKLVSSDVGLDPGGVTPPAQRRSLYVGQQGALLRAEWGIRQAPANGNHGNLSGGRYPFSVISTNTPLCRGNGTNNNNVINNTGSHRSNHHAKTKTSPSPSTFTSSLRLLSSSSSLCCENEGAVSLYQAGGAEDGLLDVWTVIKPGNVREKIAIFASASGRTDPDMRGSPPVEDRTAGAAGSNPAASVVVSRSVSMKVKGGWEGESSSAKRRRRSGSNSFPQPQNQVHTPSQPGPGLQAFSQTSRGSEGEEAEVGEEEEEGGKAVSVVEMVAFLEQRASEQQLDSKPLLSVQRSSTTIILSRNPSTSSPEQSRGAEEEGETVRVSDMVARLESECLKRRTLGGGGGAGGGGELSRNNSLRRTVGRVLLAGADSSSSQPSSPSSPSLPDVSSQGRFREDKPRKESFSLGSAPASPPCPPPASASVAESVCGAPVQAEERSAEAPGQGLVLGQMESSAGGGGHPESELTAELPQTETRCHTQSCLHSQLQTPCELKWSPQVQTGTDEPPPGMLFFSLSPAAGTLPHTGPGLPSSTHTPLQPNTNTKLYMTSDPEAPSPQNSENTEEEEQRSRVRRVEEEEEEEEEDGVVVPFPLRPSVSQDFLEARFKIQLLLEPQPYLAFLPHHLLVRLFSLLPTQTLAALKCTCHYFKFIIDNYGVRPADSRWVCDPRYRDDPCKQCKKRYGRGDVSLCRWHHKPYCQAVPYGPGYWMCCHGSHKDTPGCNVGLHDNRWVPAFHSITMPIYKRSRESEEEVQGGGAGH
ncbi:F-box only protein 34 [Polymixia lowei]